MKRCLGLMLSLVMVFSLSSFIYAEACVINTEDCIVAEEDCIVAEEDCVEGIQAISVILRNYTDSEGNRVDEKQVFFDVPPQIINDRTMLPIRAIAEELGWSVTWTDSTQKVSLYKFFDASESAVPSKSISNQAEKLYNLFKNRLDGYIMKNFSEVEGIGYCEGKHIENTILRKSKELCGKLDLYIGKDTGHISLCERGAGSLDAYLLDYRMDVPPMIVDDRTLLPVRAVAEMMGADVDWIDATKTVVIDFEFVGR